MEKTKTQVGESGDDAILRVGMDRFKTISEAELDIRKAALEDIRFTYNVDGGQWPDDIRKEREDEKRPCLTSNKLRKFVAQVSNRERDMRMAGKVIPVDDKGDDKKAKIYEDLIRQIEHQSQADETYAKGGEQAVAGGFGYWRVLTEYADDGFDREITIKGIDNQFSVYFDPKGNYCFIREGMTNTEFEQRYPNVAAVDFDSSSLGEEYALWYEDDKVFVVEYFYKEPVDKKIVQARKKNEEEYKIIEITGNVTEESLVKSGHMIQKRRTVKSHIVKWAKMTGHKVIEKRTLDGKYIPVVEVVGDKVNIAGKEYKRSLIRDGKDPQRAYNFQLTTMTETLSLSPKAPYLLSVKQLGNHKAMWETANTKNLPFLLYDDSGKSIPRREPPPQIPTAAMSLLNIAERDIKDTIGMYEPSLGAQSNERSGRALFARQDRSDLGTFHFPDNMRRAIRLTTRIIIDLIPKTYDTQRVVRIRGTAKDGADNGFSEGEESSIKINEAILVDVVKDGKIVTETQIVNDLSVGKYDLREDIRNYSTRRQETADFMLQAIQYVPTIAPLILDLLFKYQDWPGAKEIEDRILKLMPHLIQSQNGVQPPNQGGQPQPTPVNQAGL